jgi:hypothetical protein
MESSHMLQTLITDPQQYYSASLPCYVAAGKKGAPLPLTCDVAGERYSHGNHLHITSYARTRDSQPIARLTLRAISASSRDYIRRAIYVEETSNPVPGGYNWATLFLGNMNMGTWPSRLGESQMRQ